MKDANTKFPILNQFWRARGHSINLCNAVTYTRRWPVCYSTFARKHESNSSFRLKVDKDSREYKIVLAKINTVTTGQYHTAGILEVDHVKEFIVDNRMMLVGEENMSAFNTPAANLMGARETHDAKR
eukprot:671162-Hanusia_phi.AAC.1